jgi:hypothetical protein
MTHNQKTVGQKPSWPPVTDLWLLVDEEQTLRFGMRQSWRWLEAEQGSQHCTPTAASPAQACVAAPQACRTQRPAACPA